MSTTADTSEPASEPLHFIMQTRQFHGLRTRVSAGAVHRGR